MKRLPIIRHIRYFILYHRMEKHYEFWRSLGSLPVYRDHDIEVLNQIWRGEM